MNSAHATLRDGDPAAADEVGDGHRGAPRQVTVAAGITGLVAVLCALLLPFAPVSVTEPTVSWPQQPGRPESTLLTLTAYRPLALDVRFSCDVARLAATSGSIVVTTAVPGPPGTPTPGMSVTATDGRAQVRVADRLLADDPLPAGRCEYRVTGRSQGRPSNMRPAVDADGPRDLTAFAGPDDAELVITRDGRELARTRSEQLPDVDALVSSLTVLPPEAAGDLAVRLRVDDEFTSSPTPLKGVLIVVLVLALVATAGLLVRIDHVEGRAPPASARRSRAPALTWVVDMAVAAVLLAWTFVAPATDDDGWFSTQARNAALSGEVGNYYQAYDQSYVPFTWVYQGLSAWQQLVGWGPVPQRVAALVLGWLTWMALRRIAAARVSTPVLAVAFLAWWIPYDMGVRPEPVVALCAVAAMLAVLVAGRRRRLALAWLACVLVGAGFTAHTTGAILVAVLLAGLPLLWPVVRVPGAPRRRGLTSGEHAERATPPQHAGRERPRGARFAGLTPWSGTSLRVLAVGSGTMVAPLLGFADGALRDFLRGQALFLSAVPQARWTGEFERYAFLLDQSPMGNFAKRAAVLACLVALGWFVVLAVAARARRIALPTPLWLAASTTGLALVALSVTSSKWTHHFGALAGVGPAFLALMLVSAVPLTREVLGGARLPGALAAGVGVSAVAAIALAWHGPNTWPYATLAEAYEPDQPPSVREIALDSPVVWALAMVLVAAALAAWGRQKGSDDLRLRALWAVPIVVTVSLAAAMLHTVGMFSDAALRDVPPGSVWARAVADPSGRDCDASPVGVLDPFAARPLPAGGPPPSGGFVPGGGYDPRSRPQGVVGGVWGSLVAVDGRPAERTTAEMSTGWYALPALLDPGARVTVAAAGTLGGGNTLTAVYGRRVGASVVPLGAAPLADPARSGAWRTVALAPPAGADTVRLDASDASVDVGGWLAFTAPAVTPAVSLPRFLSTHQPVALGWQLAFAHPCARPPAVVDGITEPPSAALVRGGPPLSGLDDFTWQPTRGGVFGQVTRSRSVLALATVGPVDPSLQVYALGTPLARAAYTLTTDRRTVAGADIRVGTDTDDG